MVSVIKPRLAIIRKDKAKVIKLLEMELTMPNPITFFELLAAVEASGGFDFGLGLCLLFGLYFVFHEELDLTTMHPLQLAVTISNLIRQRLWLHSCRKFMPDENDI